MLERQYQAELIKKLKDRFPGSIVLKSDANYMQGFPDLLIFFKDKYAALEVKKSKGAKHQPNQDYYVNYLNDIGGFASFIFPENESEVFDAIQSALQS